MQKNSNFLNLLLSLLIAGTYIIPHNLCAKSTFQENGIPTKELKKVFQLLGVCVDTLAEANEFAQKNFLRTGERWEKQPETELHKIILENKAPLLEALKALGMIDRIMPPQKSYTYALLIGGLKNTVAQRLDFLAKLIEQGLTIEFLVLLGGERQLRDIEREELPATVTTEAQMMVHLYAQHPTLKNYKSLLVNAPMTQKADGTFTRPTSENTLTHFAKIVPHDGACLVISNNPHLVRQTMVARRILDQSRFCTDGAGQEAAENSPHTIILMDEFANALHEEFRQVQPVK